MQSVFTAAVFEEINGPLRLRELEMPEYLSVGQVLVQIKYSGICAAQLGEIADIKGVSRKYIPNLLGHEGSGIVTAIGPGVKNVKLGDHVVCHWRKGIGIESETPKYRCPELGREIGGGRVTTFQEYSIVSENRITRIDKSISLESAALLGCAVTTGIGCAANDVGLKPGQSVIVFGCGGVGLNVLQGCRLLTAYPIVGVDIDDNKLQRAALFGATSTFNSKNGTCLNPYPAMMSQDSNVFKVDFFDAAIDTTGDPRVIEWAWKISKKVCLVAQVRHNMHVNLQTLPMHRGKTIFGSDGGATDPALDIPRYLKLYEAGYLKLEELITHRWELREINLALDTVRSGKVGRAVIFMQK